MKIIALYLPQYHEIKENNNWWGQGYTEWNAVKNAQPYFKGHIQPRIPLNNYYYDLSNPTGDVWKWQSNLAKKNGVFGFCIYHYWFKSGKQLLEKPMEILLKHPEIDINYCVCWANETWRRNWYGQKSEILIAQEYGEEDEWKKHFQYLLPFFQDHRYIKIHNKPMMNIYRTFEIDNFELMKKCWNNLAIKAGFDGIFFVSGTGMHGIDPRFTLFDAYYEFEPGFSLVHNLSSLRRFLYKCKGSIYYESNKLLGTEYLERKIDIKHIYKASIKFLDSFHRKYKDITIFPGCCPMWDNTPRRGYSGFITINNSPILFKEQLIKLKHYTPDFPMDYIFVNAWNEWGEGTYLEPDIYNKYGYLEAIKEAVEN